MEPVTAIETIARAAAAANPARAGDYVEGGLLFCGVCRTPKQTRKSVAGSIMTVHCLCKCATAARDEDDAARRQREAQDRAERARETGIYSRALRNATFAAADGFNPEPLAMVRRYAEKWDYFYARDIGLLLFGGVGTGKSFSAACLANYLIDRGFSAVMLNFSEIMNILGDKRRDDQADIFDRVAHCSLFILDDFGMERQTEYALEQMFNIVDTRVKSGKPLVVTTNLSINDLKSPKDLAHKRIYDRILGKCTPVFFGEQGRRPDIAKKKFEEAAAILRG